MAILATNNVFSQKPQSLKIDEDERTLYASSNKIETLISELKEKRYLVAKAGIGPALYTTSPVLIDKIGDQEIYGWTKGAERVEYPKMIDVIILGAKKTEQREYVYFTRSDDVTLDQETFLREHRPSVSDRKIYVTTHETFFNYLNDMYPPVAAKGENSSPPKTDEKKFADQLCALPLNSILDGGVGEAKCKALGQEIFDHFKARNYGSSESGKTVVVQICESMRMRATDGHLRKQYIERAWDGIGDATWRWQS